MIISLHPKIICFCSSYNHVDSHGVHFHCYEKFRFYENWLYIMMFSPATLFKLLVTEQDIVGFSEWFMEIIRFQLDGFGRERGSEEGIQTSDSRRRFQFQNETSCEDK